ncbi:MAG: radical SAM protein [Nanoarchaeota archaeon]|nr:radical SAM protein [Nanoarchaeota archaeon]
MHPSEVIKDIKYNDLKGMNAVFVNMPIRESAAPNTTPQGPLLLATNLRDNYGVNASVIDLNGYRIRDGISEQRGLPNGRHLSERETYRLFEKHFKTYGAPDLVGLSGIITTLGWQEKTAKMIQDISPDTFLVSGGGLATELREGLFNYIPELNGVASAEGDDVIVKIAYDAITVREKGWERAISGGNLSPYYFGKFGGLPRLVYGGAGPLNLDAVPFADLTLIERDVNGVPILENYIDVAVWGDKKTGNSSAAPFTVDRSTTFVSSRGCPHPCDFCYKGMQGGSSYDVRSAENVAEEFILHKEKYGVDFIGMPDDNFAVKRKRIEELVPLLKPLNVKWGTHMRLDEAADIKNVSGDGQITFENPRRVDMMAEAGCVYVGFGAESASPRVLESMKKGGFILKNGLEEINVDGKNYSFPRSMIYGIKNSEEVGIHANCTWIMGYPGERLEDLKQSIAFIKWQEDFYNSVGKPSSSVNKGLFTATAYPGTGMFSRPEVMSKLSENFGINFDAEGKPICNENFRQYILGLEDATKVLVDKNGNPLNYSEMDDETFLKARGHINNGDLEKVLAM